MYFNIRLARSALFICCPYCRKQTVLYNYDFH